MYAHIAYQYSINHITHNFHLMCLPKLYVYPLHIPKTSSVKAVVGEQLSTIFLSGTHLDHI